MKESNLKELASGTPDLEALSEEFQWCVSRRDNNYWARQRLNYESRLCLWAGQSLDGKKWGARRDVEEVFPWPGASDARVNLIDKYINADVAVLMTAWRRMRTLCQGVEINDAAQAGRLTAVLRWMKYTQMTEAAGEAKLLANYILERGAGVMGVYWDKQTQMGYEEIDLETIMTVAMQAMQVTDTPMETGLSAAQAELPELLSDPAKEEELLDVLQMAIPDVKRKALKQACQDLRTNQTARLPRPYTIKDRPCIEALALNQDIFLPPETCDLQSARAIFRRELLTETQLRERVESRKWDQGWVDQMIETQRGVSTIEDYSHQSLVVNQGVASRGLMNTSKLFEVIHAYQRLADSNAVPGIYYTVFSRGLLRAHQGGRGGQGYAFSDLLNYEHGLYPYVLVTREARTRLIDESRGYGEVGSTWQNQIKAEWDSRIDRASLATLPPFYHPPGDEPDKWGPGIKVPTARPDAFGFMALPKWDPGSKEVELSVRMFADEYFGRPTSELNVVEGQALRQELTDNWMSAWVQIDTQMLQLMQQFMPDEFFYRVVGSQKGKPVKTTRDEIQGKFDITLSYNANDLDPEFVKAKMGLIEQALAMDVNGVIDRTEALTVAFELIDPNLGERLLQPSEEASQKEIEDEQTVFTKLLNGVDVDIKQGQAYGLRLQVLQKTMESNPSAQKKVQEDEEIKKLFEKRVKQLQFQLQQRQNAQIGRLYGTKPSATAPGMA